MKLNQKLLYIVIGALLLGVSQVGFHLTQQYALAAGHEAHAQGHETESKQETVSYTHLTLQTSDLV